MLTDLAIRAAKAVEKPSKLYDGKGLFLYVTPAAGWPLRRKQNCHGRRWGV